MITFDVLGVPAGQGSKSGILIGGKVRVVEGKSKAQRVKHGNWRSAVAEAAKNAAGPEPLTGPLRAEITFRFPRPKSRPKKHHGWHVVNPDKDKVLRATFDGLKAGGLIADDRLICQFSVAAIEVDGWTGASITIGPAGRLMAEAIPLTAARGGPT